MTIDHELHYSFALASWFIGEAERFRSESELDNAFKSLGVAASILAKQNRELTHAPLERMIIKLGGDIEAKKVAPLPSPIARNRCLHIVDEALPAGGLSSTVIRWIESDKSRIHDVALVAQEGLIPDRLQNAVSRAKGTIMEPRPDVAESQKAVWLRDVSREGYDFLVLHIGVSDVITPAALATVDLPPVILVNHAAHLFWAGSSICDLVANVRGSKLEAFWTRTYRGCDCVPVPIPLSEPFATKAQTVTQTRAKFNIPERAVLILTVGAAFKYSMFGTMDFVAAVGEVLGKHPDSYLIAAGFNGDERWVHAEHRLGGRLRTVGPLSQQLLSDLRSASDIYVESFPFGSTTSLLEAAASGIPAVLAPMNCPPPYGSDGIALDDVLLRPRDIEDWKTLLADLISNSERRRALGQEVRASVRSHHLGTGWKDHLDRAIATLPERHLVSLKSGTPTDVAAHEYWANFVKKAGSPFSELLEHSITRALLSGFRPRVTSDLVAACAKYKEIRTGIPAPLLAFLLNSLLPALPIKWAAKSFRLIAYLCRLPSKKLLRRRSKGRTVSQSWYDEYRSVKS